MVIVSVAPNGGRLQKSDHAALPLSIEQLVVEARACSDAGASLMHFHVRDDEGQHSLDAGLYREALAALRVEEGLLYQISSEGLGRYAPQEQARCVFDSGCKFASVAWREMSADGSAVARKFYDEAHERAVHLQHILYTPAECEGLRRMVEEGIIRRQGLCLLFVYGSYGKNISNISGGISGGVGGMPPLDKFLRDCLSHFASPLYAEGSLALWFLCSFGDGEQARLLRAASGRGHARVGFENNIRRCDGSLAASNAEQVASLVLALRAQKTEVASLKETRALLGLH